MQSVRINKGQTIQMLHVPSERATVMHDGKILHGCWRCLEPGRTRRRPGVARARNGVTAAEEVTGRNGAPTNQRENRVAVAQRRRDNGTRQKEQADDHQGRRGGSRDQVPQLRRDGVVYLADSAEQRGGLAGKGLPWVWSTGNSRLKGV